MKYLEKYKYIFGKPKEGAHQYRFLDTATVDYLLTIIGAMIITYFSGIPLVLTTIVIFILGIMAPYSIGQIIDKEPIFSKELKLKKFWVIR